MQFLTIKDVCSQLKLSKTTVYALINDGRLPKPFKVGYASRWVASEIDEAAQKLTEQRADWGKP